MAEGVKTMRDFIHLYTKLPVCIIYYFFQRKRYSPVSEGVLESKLFSSGIQTYPNDRYQKHSSKNVEKMKLLFADDENQLDL